MPRSARNPRAAKAPDLSKLPSVDSLLRDLGGDSAIANAPRSALLESIREELSNQRLTLRKGGAPAETAALRQAILARLDARLRPSLQPLINATGILVHTNLGRVPLANSALEAIRRTAAGYSNLEFNLETGTRGSRHAHVEGLLCELTGAEAALAVNNCAAAVMLALSALGRGKEVVVSRGELVEIGGSFRMPDIMEASGARLREVGTTNRTRIGDYAKAIGRDTGMLLKVHRSNFEVRGFTHEVDPAELVALGRKRKVPVAYDLGSGLMLESAQFGLAPEPTLRHSLRVGFDLLLCSGDKLFGGPQAGLVLGRKKAVEALRKHPMARAVRTDKLTLAALEATLRMYRDPETVLRDVPLFRMLSAPLDALEARGRAMADAIGPRLPKGIRAAVRADQSFVGGGTQPHHPIESRVVAIEGPGRFLSRLDRLLRAGRPPVVARIQDGALKMDLRTVSPDEDHPLVEALGRALAASTD